MGHDFPERLTTRTADNVELSAGVVRPQGAPRGVILAGHAMMVDARTLDRPLGQGLASTLAEQGYVVLAADFRGHGQSGTPVAQGGRWTYDDLVFQDFPALLALARQVAPGSKCAVVGHSLMGHVAAAYLGRHPSAPVHALVAMASNLWMKNRESSLRRRLRKSVDIATLAAFVRWRGHFPTRRLRMGTADESAGYKQQLIGTYTDSQWRSTSGAVDDQAGLARIRIPLLAIIGKGETYWCTPESVNAFYHPVPQNLYTFWHVGAGDHGLTHDPGHMDLVTDRRSTPLWRAVAHWLDAALAD